MQLSATAGAPGTIEARRHAASLAASDGSVENLLSHLRERMWAAFADARRARRPDRARGLPRDPPVLRHLRDHRERDAGFAVVVRARERPVGQPDVLERRDDPHDERGAQEHAARNVNSAPGGAPPGTPLYETCFRYRRTSRVRRPKAAIHAGAPKYCITNDQADENSRLTRGRHR